MGKIIKNGVEYAGAPRVTAYDAGTYSGGSSAFLTSLAQKLYSSTNKEVGVVKQFSATWSGYGDGFGFYFWKSSTKLIGCWFPSEYGGGWSVLNFSNNNGSITKFGTSATAI